jgi:RimJ/RimL family protein N-acetyltransferase
MMKVVFRHVRESDLPRLNAVVNERLVSRYLSVRPPVTIRSTRQWFAQCRKNGTSWFAVVVDGVVAGSVNLTPNRGRLKRHCVSLGLALSREFWGCGIGGRTMDFAIKWAKERGFMRLELCVFLENRRAIRLYRSRGFIREGTQRKALRKGFRFVDEHLMVRFLR